MNKVLLFIFLFNLAASAAQATESIASPQIHTKDVWQYNKLDLLSGDVVGTERFKVVEISGNQITSKIEITPKPANGSGTWLVYTDAAWNIIDNGGATFTPSNGIFHILRFAPKQGRISHVMALEPRPPEKALLCLPVFMKRLDSKWISNAEARQPMPLCTNNI